MNIKPTNISDEEKTRIFEESLKNQTPYVEKEPVKIQSVKHGYWEEITDYGGWGDTHYRCSVCGEDWYLEDGTPKQNNMNFCPKCGARMDLKDGEIDE